LDRTSRPHWNASLKPWIESVDVRLLDRGPEPRRHLLVGIAHVTHTSPLCGMMPTWQPCRRSARYRSPDQRKPRVLRPRLARSQQSGGEGGTSTRIDEEQGGGDERGAAAPSPTGRGCGALTRERDVPLGLRVKCTVAEAGNRRVRADPWRGARSSSLRPTRRPPALRLRAHSDAPGDRRAASSGEPGTRPRERSG